MKQITSLKMEWRDKKGVKYGKKLYFTNTIQARAAKKYIKKNNPNVNIIHAWIENIQLFDDVNDIIQTSKELQINHLLGQSIPYSTARYFPDLLS